MPIFKTYIHGNLPVEIELTNDGEFLDAWCDHVAGRVQVILSDEEIHNLMNDNMHGIQDFMEEYHRDMAEQAAYDRAEMRRGK